ncbi:hypothetical protein [Aquisalimonas asiatica]|uniref:Uncharacterized protein n=1 Tax=Aquisalimonas asiatica TaxID=406100 RepID=A0A1H8RPF9_9GAMM|nr:hypothetical protein [Aquisalimonas asiatica]SEO68270.1 hypothetical protein SAMN04488052_102162 [Aquisalimonas asiatica]
MSEHNETTLPPQPDRRLPLLHALLACVVIALLYAPFLETGDGQPLTLMDISGAWGTATLVVLAVLALAAVLMIAADRVGWGNVLVVDMMIVLGLIPLVLGIVLNWEAPAAGVAGFAWGFWAAIVLLIARFPLSIWIRSQAAKAQAHAREGGGDST